jgi:hypothetical protein
MRPCVVLEKIREGRTIEEKRNPSDDGEKLSALLTTQLITRLGLESAALAIGTLE